MKFEIVICLFVALPAALAIFSMDVEISMRKYEDDCAKESGITLDEMNTIRKNRAVPDNEKANKWAKCMMQKHNVIKSDGTVNMDVKTITIPADTDSVIKAFEICKSLTGNDIASTARLMMNCYFTNSEGLLMGFARRT